MTLSRDIPPLYLDHAATTPVDPEVAEAMLECLRAGDSYGNPASSHPAGRRAAALVKSARSEVAELLNVAPREIVFTSGATESDNLALIGGARFRAHRGRHLVTMLTEHKAVLAAMDALERESFEVTRLAPGPDGLLDAGQLLDALRDDTQIVSVMQVNNETGVVQDIAAIASLCRERDILFHCDAAQSVGKLPVDLGQVAVDLLSLSGHKMGAPQGIGALFVRDRRGCGVQPLLHGGAQERRLRAGSQPLALIHGFGVAAKLARQRQADTLAHFEQLHARLWAGLKTIPGIRRNGSATAYFPGILNVSLAEVEGESLQLALEPVCVASGSACNAQSGDASAVLKSMGLTDLEVQGAIRLSFGRLTRAADVDIAIHRCREAIEHLAGLSAPAQVA